MRCRTSSSPRTASGWIRSNADRRAYGRAAAFQPLPQAYGVGGERGHQDARAGERQDRQALLRVRFGCAVAESVRGEQDGADGPGVALALPAINETPDGFPATDLWQFRLASLGAQAIIWAMLGLLFGVAAERVLTDRELSLRSETA